MQQMLDTVRARVCLSGAVRMHYTYVLMSERDKHMARYNSEGQVGTALERLSHRQD